MSPRLPRKSISTIKSEPSDKSDEFLDAINKFLTDSQPAYELTGPIKVPVCLQNDTYKSSSLVGNEQFMLGKARRGGKGQIIFEGKPLDAQPYKHADFAEKVAFEALIGLDKEIAGAFAIGEEFISDLEPTALWEHTKLVFMGRLKTQKLEAKKKEEAATADLYKNNPTWGMF